MESFAWSSGQTEAQTLRKNHYNLATKLECIFAFTNGDMKHVFEALKLIRQKLLAIPAS